MFNWLGDKMKNWLGIDENNVAHKVFDWDAYYKDIASGVSSSVIEGKFRKMEYYVDAS